MRKKKKSCLLNVLFISTNVRKDFRIIDNFLLMDVTMRTHT